MRLEQLYEMVDLADLAKLKALLTDIIGWTVTIHDIGGYARRLDAERHLQNLNGDDAESWIEPAKLFLKDVCRDWQNLAADTWGSK